MNEENKKIYEGCEKLGDGRWRIREKMTTVPIKCKEPITEKIMVEGKEVSPTRKYKFCVWNEEFNGNGRNYKYVIPRVIEENRPTFCLADHPLDGCDADSVRICGCGKNYRKENGWLVCDYYPLGELGNRIADGWDLGVPATISSSVLGELDDDNYVVNSNSFYLERILDVLGCELPSNGVFHYQDHNEQIDDDYAFTTISEQGFNENLTILNNKSNIVESSENTQNDKTDEIENNENIGEKEMPENTMNELAEQSMILNIKSMIKDADKLEDPIERKESLVSAHGFAKKLTDSSLYEEISKKIEDAENEIKELSVKGLQTDDLTDKVKALEDELAQVKGECETLKSEKAEVEDKLKTLTDMYDEEQYKASETELELNAELEEKNHRLSKEICSLKAKNRNLEGMMRKNSRVLESKMKKLDAEANTMVDVETFLKCKNKCKTLEDENADLSAKVEELENTIATMKKTEDAIDVEIGAEEILDLKKKLNEMVQKNNRLRKMLNESRMAKLEKKESRFSQLRKSMEEDEDEVIVDNEIIEDDEIEDSEIEVTDNGIEVVAENEERDEDEIMEKALNGTLGK